jgi:uncharacterized protein (TIGR03067 family)
MYLLQSNHKGAAFFKESFAMNDWTKYSGLYVDVFNPENIELTISIDICTGDAWFWQESVEYPLQPGLNKDFVIDLLASTFRSETTGWEYIGELQNMNDVKRVVLRVNGPTGLESSVFVDAIRLWYYQSELEGTWKGPLVNQPSYIWTIAIVGHKAVVLLNNVEQYRAVFVFIPDTEPKQIDGRIYSANNPNYVGKTSLAIYQFDGDTLMFAGNEPGITTRPASFAPVTGTAVMALKKQ